MMTEIHMSRETFKLLFQTWAISHGSFIATLPKLKEKLGLIVYANLLDAALEAISSTRRQEFESTIEEGRLAQEAGTPLSGNPYPVTPQDAYHCGGWNFGWIEADREP